MADLEQRRGLMRRALPYVGLVAFGLAVGVGLLAATEMALRLLDIEGSNARDPFAGFSHVVRMFQQTTRDGQRVYQLSPGTVLAATGRARAGPQREFPVRKRPRTFRIFTVGDSSAAGVPYGWMGISSRADMPYSTGYAFTFWLARRLEAALPAVRFEVVNAAMPGYASRRLVTVVDEIVGYKPDLVIIYNGHNEFAEQRYYQHLLDMDPRLFRAREWLARSRLWRVLSSFLERNPNGDGDAPRFDMEQLRETGEMFAVLDARAEGERYPTARERAYGELLYRTNLETMVRAIQSAGARALLVTLTQNFASWAPGASAHRDGLSASERETWGQLVREGNRRAEAREWSDALAAYERALAIDDQYADVVYRLAVCEEALGRFDAARDTYRRASDLDQVPHGAPTRFNEILGDVAQSAGALLVDADAALTAASPHGIVGDNLFVDWVHPMIRAHQIIGAAIAAEMRHAGVPLPADQWRPGYVDPDPDRMIAENVHLRIGEHMARLGTCVLAHRASCALPEIDALIALESDNPVWKKAREDLLKKTESWTAPQL